MTMAAQRAPARVGVGTHFLRYASSGLLVMLAGLVSFPLLTRLLDNTQYGILGYYETWVMIAIAVAKLGAQHAIVRFYPYGGDAQAMRRFSTNLFLLPLLVSGGVWAVGIAVVGGVAWARALTLSPILWCALLAIPLNVFISLVQMVLRAGERSDLLSGTRVIWRWMELAGMVGAVLLLERSALAAYGGKLLAAGLVVAFYLRWVLRHLQFARSELDMGAFAQSVRYGMPLVINEIATVLLISIDRVMLKSLTGDYAAVGIYTIGYSLALQVSMLMHATLSESFVPVANRRFETEGPAAVRALKRQVLFPMTYAAIGVAVAIACVATDAIVAVSGPDKAMSGPVFAWIGAQYALYPLFDIAGYGLLLHKRSMTVLALTLIAAIGNILLNLWWVPSLGLMGAVYATTVCYAFLGLSGWWLCPRELRAWPDLRAVVTAVLGAGLFWVALRTSGISGWDNVWLRLFAAGGLWALLYGGSVLSDPRMRRWVVQLRHRG